ncbi:MAG: hypothetical protein ACI31G_03890 [Bacilli bacterium]
MKKFLTFHFKSSWFLYLVYFLLSILISSVLISNITKTPNSKKVDIFIGANYTLPNELNDYIYENKPDKLKEVNISYYDPDSVYFGAYYASKGMNCDIVILPTNKDVIDEENISVYMARMEKDIIDNYFSYSFVYYEIDSYYYGLKVYDGETKDGYLKNLFNEEDENTYYLFFVDGSSHIRLIDLLGLDSASLEIMKVINSYVI